mgnify:FL=1
MRDVVYHYMQLFVADGLKIAIEYCYQIDSGNPESFCDLIVA